MCEVVHSGGCFGVSVKRIFSTINIFQKEMLAPTTITINNNNITITTLLCHSSNHNQTSPLKHTTHPITIKLLFWNTKEIRKTFPTYSHVFTEELSSMGQTLSFSLKCVMCVWNGVGGQLVRIDICCWNSRGISIWVLEASQVRNITLRICSNVKSIK